MECTTQGRGGEGEDSAKMSGRLVAIPLLAVMEYEYVEYRSAVTR